MFVFKSCSNEIQDLFFAPGELTEKGFIWCGQSYVKWIFHHVDRDIKHTSFRGVVGISECFALYRTICTTHNQQILEMTYNIFHHYHNRFYKFLCICSHAYFIHIEHKKETDITKQFSWFCKVLIYIMTFCYVKKCLQHEYVWNISKKFHFILYVENFSAL